MSHHVTFPSSLPTGPHHPPQPSTHHISCTTDLNSSQHVSLDVSSPSHITSFSDIPHVPLPRCPTRILESAPPGHVPEKAAPAISTAGETHKGHRASKFHEGSLSTPIDATGREGYAPPREVQPAAILKDEGVWGKVKGKFGGRKH